MTNTISRRDLLRVSAIGLAGVAVAPGQRALGDVLDLAAAERGDVVSLTMRACLVEMVDGTRVHMWAYETPTDGLRVPGPVIEVTEGDPVAIDVTNALERPHAFAVPGVVDSGPIEPGGTARVRFTAPAAGTYLYLDPMDAPRNRAMGLAGVLVVLPRSPGLPYSAPTDEVRNLFADLGDTDEFPGRPWDPARSWVWVFSSVDPAAHARVADDPDLPAPAFLADYAPAYFLLNGRSGYFAGHDPASVVRGRVGQPALIRSVNVGLATHSPHIHGNHVFVLADDGRVHDNLVSLDTWRLPPLRRTDVLHPFVRPPDAWPWPPSDPSVWETDLAGDGTAGMVFPMHCHLELSQLAAGANYPQGLLTHWVLEGDLDPAPPPPPTTSTTTTTPPPTTTTSSTTTTTRPTTTTTTTAPRPRPRPVRRPPRRLVRRLPRRLARRLRLRRTGGAR